MANHKEVKPVNIEKLVYFIGLVIFGGLFLDSLLNAGKYTDEALLQYRIFVLVAAVIFYAIVYLYHRVGKSRKPSTK